MKVFLALYFTVSVFFILVFRILFKDEND